MIVALLGVLEQWFSLRAIFLGVGFCGLGVSLFFIFLNEPVKPTVVSEIETEEPAEAIPLTAAR